MNVGEATLQPKAGCHLRQAWDQSVKGTAEIAKGSVLVGWGRVSGSHQCEASSVHWVNEIQIWYLPFTTGYVGEEGSIQRALLYGHSCPEAIQFSISASGSGTFQVAVPLLELRMSACE